MFCLDIQCERTADSPHDMNAYTRSRCHTTLTFTLIGQTSSMLRFDWVAVAQWIWIPGKDPFTAGHSGRVGDRLTGLSGPRTDFPSAASPLRAPWLLILVRSPWEGPPSSSVAPGTPGPQHTSGGNAHSLGQFVENKLSKLEEYGLQGVWKLAVYGYVSG